jgi:hypothetical protein
MTKFGATLARPLRVELPWSPAAPLDVTIPVHRLRTPARLASTLLLATLMVVGVVVACASALAAETDTWEGAGTLGTELGAVLWFAGAVTWGARRGPTVARAVMLSLMFVGGLSLIVVALIGEWSGAALSLAMEFGVGMLAVPLIDVVLIGSLHDRLQQFAASDATPVVVRVGGRQAEPSEPR